MLLIMSCNKLKYDYGCRIIDEWDEQDCNNSKKFPQKSSS